MFFLGGDNWGGGPSSPPLTSACGYRSLILRLEMLLLHLIDVILNYNDGYNNSC